MKKENKCILRKDENVLSFSTVWYKFKISTYMFQISIKEEVLNNKQGEGIDEIRKSMPLESRYL